MTVKLRPTKTEISQLKKGEAVEILKDLGLSDDEIKAIKGIK